PLSPIFTDSRGLAREMGFRAVELAVVLEAVNPYFETGLLDGVTEGLGCAVLSGWDEIEGRAEAQLLLNCQEGFDAGKAPMALDVMGEHEREAFVPRPAWPAWRNGAGLGVNWPYMFVGLPPGVCPAPPDCYADG